MPYHCLLCIFTHRTQDWNSTVSLPDLDPMDCFKNITAERSLLVSEEDRFWALCFRLPKSWNPGRILLTDTLSLSAPSHKKGCLGFQNMLFVQPQRGTAPCRLRTAGLTELSLAGREGEKKHDGMTGWQPDRSLRTQLLPKWENWIVFHLIWKLASVLGMFLTSFSQHQLLKRSLKRKLGKVYQWHGRNRALTPSSLRLQDHSGNTHLTFTLRIRRKQVCQASRSETRCRVCLRWPHVIIIIICCAKMKLLLLRKPSDQWGFFFSMWLFMILIPWALTVSPFFWFEAGPEESNCHMKRQS